MSEIENLGRLTEEFQLIAFQDEGAQQAALVDHDLILDNIKLFTSDLLAVNPSRPRLASRSHHG